MSGKVRITLEKGQRFGRLTIIKEVERVYYVNVSHRQFECICDCGNIKKIRLLKLRNNSTKSCGCIQKEFASKNLSKIASTKIHGHYVDNKPTPTMVSYNAMKQRCFNLNNDNYLNYGGRGITVCERWMNFDNFLKDMGERPVGTTLDRIDVNGNYEPNNCRWATPKEQANNRR